mmetsp:Transcript_10174/g.28548  ORF Transcript_10174/g.28548 Transcript_10174/m.28548 type:complete len:293 (-) Transcript_10174:378-1256(-)
MLLLITGAHGDRNFLCLFGYGCYFQPMVPRLIEQRQCHGLGAVRDYIEVVASLQSYHCRYINTRRGQEAASHPVVHLWRQKTVTDKITLGGIEPATYHHQARIERAHQGQNQLGESSGILHISNLLDVPRDVEIGALGGTMADLLGTAGAGKEKVVAALLGDAVEAHVQDVGVVVRQILSTISVMDVPVQHQHPLAFIRMTNESVLGGHGDAVEETKSHGARLAGVMAGGTHDGECSGCRGALEVVGRRLLRARTIAVCITVAMAAGAARGDNATCRIKGGNVPGRFIPLLL